MDFDRCVVLLNTISFDDPWQAISLEHWALKGCYKQNNRGSVSFSLNWKMFTQGTVLNSKLMDKNEVKIASKYVLDLALSELCAKFISTKIVIGNKYGLLKPFNTENVTDYGHRDEHIWHFLIRFYEMRLVWQNHDCIKVQKHNIVIWVGLPTTIGYIGWILKNKPKTMNIFEVRINSEQGPDTFFTPLLLMGMWNTIRPIYCCYMMYNVRYVVLPFLVWINNILKMLKLMRLFSLLKRVYSLNIQRSYDPWFSASPVLWIEILHPEIKEGGNMLKLTS